MIRILNYEDLSLAELAIWRTDANELVNNAFNLSLLYFTLKFCKFTGSKTGGVWF